MISGFIGNSWLRCASASAKVLTVEVAAGSGGVPTAIRAECEVRGFRTSHWNYTSKIIYICQSCEPLRSPYLAPMPGHWGSPRGPSGELLGAHTFYLSATLAEVYPVCETSEPPAF